MRRDGFRTVGMAHKLADVLDAAIQENWRRVHIARANGSTDRDLRSWIAELEELERVLSQIKLEIH